MSKIIIVTGTEKINSICEQILSLSEQDFKECEAMAMEQKDFIHPLRLGKQARLNELGAHNLRVVHALKTLAAILVDPNTKTS